MDFCYALNALKEGLKVERSGWNGKGMYIYLVPGHQEVTGGGPASMEDGDGLTTPAPNEHRNMTLNILPHIRMKTVQGDHVPWLASQTDLLSEDWSMVIVESASKGPFTDDMGG